MTTGARGAARRLRIAFLRRDRSFADVARRLGITRAAVAHVVVGRKATPRIRRALARAAGRRLSEIWK